jgi:hypothetical protein
MTPEEIGKWVDVWQEVTAEIHEAAKSGGSS